MQLVLSSFTIVGWIAEDVERALVPIMLSWALFPGSPQEFETIELWRRRRKRITAMDDGRTMRVFGEVLIILATGQN